MSTYLEDLVGRDRASVAQTWLRRVETTPDAPFLCWQEGVLTYEEAHLQVRRAATRLLALGVERGGRVASFLPNRPEALWAWFATHCLGGVYVALNREQRGQLLSSMVERSEATVVIADDAGAELLPRSVPIVSADELCANDDADDLGDPGVAADDLASILFTSGTTGRSKAVMLPHNQLARGGARFAESIAQRPSDRWHAWMPMSHVFGQLHVTMATVVSGGSLALYPRFSASAFWEEVDRDRCTIFGGLGNMLRMLWHAPDSGDHAENGLRVGLVATPPPELREPFSATFGVELVDSYGMTEAEPVTLPVPGMPPTSCGVESPDFEIAILDEHGNRLGAGERGEIGIRPRVPGVMFQGYEGDPQATVDAWRDLWFHTTDVGMIDGDGYCYLLDRRKDVIRTRGENVSPSEVERVIREHPGVRDCAVVAVPSDHVDDDVLAIIVAEVEASVTAAAIREHCHGSMARFMIPAHVVFRPELPYSHLGKVDREALKREFASAPA